MMRLVQIGLLGALALAGCAPERPGTTAVATFTDDPGLAAPTVTEAPTALTLPSPESSVTALPPAEALTYTPVEVDELGLLVEVPASWRRLEPSWAWSSGGDDAPRLELVGRPVPPPQEVEAALLPSPATILDSSPVELSWGAGRRFTLELYGTVPVDGGKAPVLAVETHVLVVISQQGTRYAYDFISRARTQEGLKNLLPMLQHMLETSARLDG